MPQKQNDCGKEQNSFAVKKYDDMLSWSDESFYSTEMIWKMYKNALNIEICELGKISDFNMTGTSAEKAAKKKYGQPLPPGSQFLSPDAIYKSPKLDVIYER